MSGLWQCVRNRYLLEKKARRLIHVSIVDKGSSLAMLNLPSLALDSRKLELEMGNWNSRSDEPIHDSMKPVGESRVWLSVCLDEFWLYNLPIQAV